VLPAASRHADRRFSVPGLPRPLVRRDRLESQLRDTARRQITLVSGLPGAGKTTLVASWLRAADHPAAWLSLDARHNEPGRLARAVLRALAAVSAAPEPPARRRRSYTRLLDEALDAMTDGQSILVLDDVHELRSADALAALGHLLDRSPAPLSLVLCARADPPVALGRLRLDGRLGEIRNADLEFTQAETADLFAAHGIDLRHDDVLALWLRTQGWIAGLRLAAGALTSAGDPHELVRNTAATEAAVADYLLEEVLDRQEPGTQSFLLRTSVAEHLTPDLASLLADDDRAQERLDELERTGVFLTDASADGSYHYHALFADLLRATLRRRHPELVDELHGRAADWLLAAGRTSDAERHARLAGDWTLVGRLAIDRWLTAALDDTEPSPDPLAGTPPAVVRETPALTLVAAAMACMRGDRDGADLHRGRLDELVGPLPAPTVPAADDVHRRILDLSYGWAFGADERSSDAARVLVAVSDTQLDVGAPSLRRLARLRGAELELDAGRFDGAVATLNALADALDDEWVCAEAAALVAIVHAANGNLAAAESRTAEVLSSGDPVDIRPTALQAAHLAKALCCAQRGERRNAVAHVHETDTGGAVASRPVQAVRRALRSALDGPAPSTAWLDTATATHPLAAQALLACGALEIVDPQRRVVALGGPCEHAAARARQDLSRGAPDAARVGLDRSLSGPATSAHLRTLVEAHTLATIASTASGHDADARRHLSAALELAAGSGVRAPLLDHAPALAGVLDPESLAAEHRGLALELLDHLRRAPAGAPVEGLTDRETAVLQYLPTLMSNAEIAQGLHLSINTVKSHLKAVYRKLGVDGRRDAVLRGRELELI
jgi:LuxR family transcriptional regulator, maltose regulon positive regulatory protein